MPQAVRGPKGAPRGFSPRKSLLEPRGAPRFFLPLTVSTSGFRMRPSGGFKRSLVRGEHRMKQIPLSTTHARCQAGKPNGEPWSPLDLRSPFGSPRSDAPWRAPGRRKEVETREPDFSRVPNFDRPQ